MVYAIILLGLALTLIAVRFRNIPLRRIAAYSNINLTVSEAVESGRTAHISFGASSPRDASAASAIAAAEIGYFLALRAAPGDKPALLTMSDPVTLALAQDRLRRAYRLRDLMSKYRSTLARWYPQGPLSLAYAAGVGAAMLDEDASTNIVVGKIGPEMMLIAENAIRYDRFFIGQSDQTTGQAVAYVVSDSPLIGEELYVSPAYFDRSGVNAGGVVAQDVLRYLLIGAIIFLAVLSFLGIGF